MYSSFDLNRSEVFTFDSNSGELVPVQILYYTNIPVIQSNIAQEPNKIIVLDSIKRVFIIYEA